jgi:hypothetical protein
MLKRFAMFALLTVALFGAKTYSFRVAAPTQAGKVQLQAGDYSLKLDGSQVVLMDKAGARIDATAKVETNNETFKETSVSVSEKAGTKRIDYIQLRGTKNKVVFE